MSQGRNESALSELQVVADVLDELSALVAEGADRYFADIDRRGHVWCLWIVA